MKKPSKTPTFTEEQMDWLEDKLLQKLSITCLSLGGLKRILEELRCSMNMARNKAGYNGSDTNKS